MFSLHENTRIGWCRAAFVALCLLPTCAVAAWCVAVRLPGYRHGHERSIGECLGCQARLAGVSSPRPGVILYRGLELKDHDTGQLLARVPFVELETSGGSTTVRLPYPATINGLRLDAAIKCAQRTMRQADGGPHVQFAAQNLTVHLKDGDQTLTDVGGQLERAADESRLVLTFRLATAGTQQAGTQQAGATRGGPSALARSPASLTIVRGRSPVDKCTLEFTTGGAPLPCSLLASSWPPAALVGKAATFDGAITATERDKTWQLKLAGRIDGIEMARLISPFPHSLTGSGQLQIKHATVDAGRLVRSAGTLSAGPGTISRSLIHAAQDNLQLEASRAALVGRDNHLPYKQLSLAFEIDDAGLALAGTIPELKGAVLADGQQVLLRPRDDARRPVVNFVRMLVPQTAVQVPATQATGPLATFLPVPPLVPPPGSEAPLPQARSIRVVPQ